MKTPLLILALAFMLTSASAQTWKPVSSPIYGGALQEYIADRNGVLYGYQGLYVVRSTDKGLTWKEISPKNNLSIDDLSVPYGVGVPYGVAVLPDPVNGEVVVVYPKTGSSSLIYVSYSGGSSWLSTTVPAQFIGAKLTVFGLRNGRGLAFAESSSSTIVLSSSDGGQTWYSETELLSRPSAVHESSSGVVYVPDGSTIRRRAIDGTWSTIPSPAPGKTVNRMCAAGSRIFLASDDKVYLSTNEGTSWAATTYEIGDSSPNSQFLVGFSDGSAAMFTVVQDTFTSSYRIKSDSIVWTTVANNIPWAIRSAVGFGNSNIAINRPAGMNFSDTWGANWELRAEGISFQPIYRFAINGSTIIAVSILGDIYRGTVGGSSWDYIGHPMSYYSWVFPIREVVAVAPSVFVGGTATGIMRSTDDGITWEFQSNRESFDMCKRKDGSIVSLEEKRIMSSSDLGLSWQPLALFDNLSAVRSLSEGASGTLYVAAKNGLYTVDGDSLRLVDQINAQDAVLATASASNALTYGVVGVNQADETAEFSLTLDGGTTWTTRSMQLNGGVLLDAVITNSGHLYASLYNAGTIHMTPSGVITSAGRALQEFTLGLQLDPLQHLMRGRVSVIEKSEEPVSVQEVQTSDGLFVSPLPATDVVRIRGIVEGTYDVRLVDVLGSVVSQQSVTTLNDVATLDVRTLAPGRYSAIIGTAGVHAMLLIVR